MKERFVGYCLLIAICLSTLQSDAQSQVSHLLRSGKLKKINSFYTRVTPGYERSGSAPTRPIIYRDIIPQTEYQRIYAFHREGRSMCLLSAIVDKTNLIIWRLETVSHDSIYSDKFDTTGIVDPDYDGIGGALEPIYRSLEEMVRAGSGRVIGGTNEKLYLQFKLLFKNYYGLEFNEDLNLFNVLTMYSCGYNGEFRNPARTIYSIINKKDTVTLNRWIRSGNIVLQIYALETYMKSGIKIDDDLKMIASYSLSCNSILDVCSGCTSDISTVKELAEKIGLFEWLKN